MTRFNHQVLDLLMFPRTLEEREKNITVLREQNQLVHLEPREDVTSLFQKTDNIPRYLEKHLIIDFDRKRSMITEMLFDIHKYHPKIFPLSAYSDIAKRVFAVVTKYCWSGEDASIVIRLISIHIRPYLKYIPESFFITTFLKHDGALFFSKEELQSILKDSQNEYDIPVHRRFPVRKVLDSVEDVRYLQKVFRKDYHYFSELFGTELLDGFLAEDTDTIVSHDELTHTYIQIFQEILMKKIDTLNITSNRKIAYKASINKESSLRAILFWSDLLLKKG